MPLHRKPRPRPDDPRDALGREVPWWQKKFFSGRRRQLALADQLAACRKELHRIAKTSYGALLRDRAGKLGSLLEFVETELKANAPFCTCMESPHGEHCCGGKKWLSARELNKLCPVGGPSPRPESGDVPPDGTD